MNFLHWFIGSSVFLAVLLSLGQLAPREKDLKSYLLSFLFLQLAAMQFYFFSVITRLNYSYPHIFRVHTPVLFCLRPTLYLFFETEVSSKLHWQKKDFLHYIPALVAIACLSPFYLQSHEQKLVAIETLFVDFKLGLYDVPIVMGLVMLVGYVGYMLFLLSPLLNLKSLKSDFSLRLFMGLFLLIITTIFVSATAIVIGKAVLTEGTAMGIAIILVLVYIFQKRFPEFFQKLNVNLKEERYKRSLLTSIDTSEIKENLRRLMQEKLFLEEDITLASLAQSVDLSAHQLSEFLNSKLEVNFFGYINSLRIEEACRKLHAEREKPILTIAYEVGFNAKSSFHTAFVKTTGKNIESRAGEGCYSF